MSSRCGGTHHVCHFNVINYSPSSASTEQETLRYRLLNALQLFDFKDIMRSDGVLPRAFPHSGEVRSRSHPRRRLIGYRMESVRWAIGCVHCSTTLMGGVGSCNSAIQKPLFDNDRYVDICCRVDGSLLIQCITLASPRSCGLPVEKNLAIQSLMRAGQAYSLKIFKEQELKMSNRLHPRDR